MAVAYANEGAVTLAAGSWSDSTGFANAAQLVINKPCGPFTGGLDQSATSIEYLDVVADALINIGSSGSNAKFDADGTTYSAYTRVSRIRFMPADGTMYYEAAGNNTLAHIIEVGRGGRFYLVSGIVNFVVVQSGYFNANQSCTFGDTGRVDVNGGVAYIDTHASDLIPELNVMGGTCTVKRGGVASTGQLRIGQGGTCTLDSDGGAWPLIRLSGGRLNWITGGAPGTTNGNVVFESGTVDFTKLARPVTIDKARISPAVTVLGKDHPLLTLTSVENLGWGNSAGLGR